MRWSQPAMQSSLSLFVILFNIQSAKETVYSVRDGISETITELSKVPDKVQSMAKTIVDFVENIPAFFQ
jgi:hypothetical protein